MARRSVKDYLLVDMGNTAIKWCLAPSHRKGLGPVHSEAWNTDGSGPETMARSMAKAITQQTQQGPSAGRRGLGAGALEMIYCSVAPEQRTATLVVSLCEALGCEARPFLSQARLKVGPDKMHRHGQTLELVNGYKNPSQLGSDRWAALWGLVSSPALWPESVAAYGQTEGSVVLVSAGTATVMDWLSVDAPTPTGLTRFHFQGGTIRPGYGLMAKVLGESAAGLGPQSPVVTRAAMQQGIAQAQVSGVFSRGRPCLVAVHGGYARQWLKDYVSYFGAAGQGALVEGVKRPAVVHAPGLILKGLKAWRQALY
jgi:pantothenate kinase type III